MPYERAPFGDGATNVTTNVSAHFETREVGGVEGVIGTVGSENTATVNFDESGPIYTVVNIPTGALVTDIRGYGLTGSISTATVGSQDISAAQDDTDTTWVTVTGAGGNAVAVTGPTAGTVVVKFRFVAGA